MGRFGAIRFVPIMAVVPLPIFGGKSPRRHAETKKAKVNPAMEGLDDEIVDTPHLDDTHHHDDFDHR